MGMPQRTQCHGFAVSTVVCVEAVRCELVAAMLVREANVDREVGLRETKLDEEIGKKRSWKKVGGKGATI